MTTFQVTLFLLLKVCCIQSLVEAQQALQVGADLLVLVSERRSGPGIISVSKIAELIQVLPGSAKIVLLTSPISTASIVAQYQQRASTRGSAARC